MCNAWNHSPGCDCGFGPPYPWKIEVGPRISWSQQAVRSRRYYRKALAQMGLGISTIEEELNSYSAEGFPISSRAWRRLSKNARRSRLSIFDRLFSRYHLEESDYEDREVDIPIFLLHSSRTQQEKKGERNTFTKAKVEFLRQESVTAATVWSVRLFGFGPSSTQSFTIEHNDHFYSEYGACKLIRLPVTLRLTRLDILKDGQLISTILRVEPSPRMERVIIHAGAKLLAESKCTTARPSASKKPELYPYINEPNIASPSKKFESGKEHAFSEGIEAFNLEGKFRAEIHRATTLTLMYTLPGGFNYLMVPLEKPEGIKCEVVGEK